MSEFKFACAHCGQHLTADDAWAGRQINCPACQGPLVIPHMAVAAAPGQARTAPAPPPLPRVSAGAAVAAPVPRLSVLAIFSLLLSLLTLPLNALAKQAGFPVGLFGCIPGVICGHLALAQIRGHRSLRGEGIAQAGLVIGYLCLLVGLVAMGIYGVRRYVLNQQPPGRRAAQVDRYSSPARSAATPSTTPASPPKPPDPKVTTNPATVAIPSSPVAGQLGGQEFRCDKAILESGSLKLCQGAGPMPEAELRMFLFLQPGEVLDGKRILVSSDARSGTPHVHFSAKAGASPRSGALVNKYVLRLEFDRATASGVPGRIYLEFPPSYNTLLAGTFTAQRK